jgi:hypothetical protein
LRLGAKPQAAVSFISPGFPMLTGLCLIACLVNGASASPPLRIEPGKGTGQVCVVAILPPELSAKLPSGKLSQEQGGPLLRLYLVVNGKEGPSILGTYERRGEELRFTPRYALEPGGLCRARFAKSSVAYRVPLPPPAPAALVERVYPTGDVLPANHLRFYLYFSRPMRGGQDIFDQIQILDAKGNPVNMPWLRDELWDEKGQRLILYIHPGRIKWALLLRLTLGPVLVPEREYTLVIPRDMLDADGRKLGREYRKKFRTTAEDRVRIDTAAWSVKTPAAGSTQALVVQFDKAVDQASLQRFLSVMDSKGEAVAGTLGMGAKERSWSFQPSAKWRDEEYTVKINPQLEDPAGNTPERPFDVDRRTPEPRTPPLLKIPFRPRNK